MDSRGLGDMAHLPEDLHGISVQAFRKTEGGKFPSLEELERSYIKWVLNETARIGSRSGDRPDLIVAQAQEVRPGWVKLPPRGRNQVKA